MSLYYSFAGFRFDAERLVLKKGTSNVQISETPAKVLRALLRHHRADKLEYEVLIKEVWPDGADIGRLRTYISKLRKLFGEKGFDKYEVIETVSKGLQFKPEVKVEGDEPRISLAPGESPIALRKPYLLLRGRGDAIAKINRPKWARTAEKIDMMGLSLHSGWFRDVAFSAALTPRVKSGALRLRVLLPSPDSPFYQQYLKDYRSGLEDSKDPDEDVNRLIRNLGRSTKKAAAIAEGSVRHLHEEIVPCGLVRFDNVMKLSAHRYPFQQGYEATLLIENREEPQDEDEELAAEIFDMYRKSFNQLWEKAGQHPLNR